MMEDLILTSTEQMPSIFFDVNKGVLKIEGKSYSDDVNLSYADLFKRIKAYSVTPQTETVIDFNWLYYNTATTRIIVKIILQLSEVSKVKVNWHCKTGSSLMIKKGKEIGEALEIDLAVVLHD